MDMLSNKSDRNFWQAVCEDTLLDLENALNSSKPYISECFRDTILTWPIGIFLIFATLFQAHALSSRKKDAKLKCTWMVVLKLILNAVLLIVSISDIGLQIVRITRYERVPISSNIGIILNWLFILDLFVLTLFTRVKSRRSSGVVWIGWFLLTVFGLLKFCHAITSVSSGNTTTLVHVQNILFLISYPLIVSELILNSFADVYVDGTLVEENECPESGASFLNKIAYYWLVKLAIQCYKRSLNHEDLWKLRRQDTSDTIIPRWERYWNAALGKKRQKSHPAQSLSTVKLTVADEKITSKYKSVANDCPSLVWNLLKTVKWELIPAIVLKLTSDILSFSSPLILKLLLWFIDTKGVPLWMGLFLAFLMFITSMIYSVLWNQSHYRMSIIAMNVRTALTSTVYKKALRLCTASKKGSTTGEMVNLMAVDINRISDTTQWVSQLWSTPVTVTISLYLLYAELGYSALAGFVVMILFMPINFLLGKYQRQRQVKMMSFKDQRMKLMNEILNGMKVLKLYAWEPPFEKKVMDVRKKEIGVLKIGSYFDASNAFTFSCAPFFIAVASFATFVLSSPENVLTAQKAFVSLSIFNMLRPAINMLPMVISAIVQASVSNKRIKKFLAEPELNTNLVVKNGVQEESILVYNGTFAWTDSDDLATLNEINLSVKPGQLVAIVGPVGCGKSSLLSAILGDMEPKGGVVYVKGSVAYVPQQAWIQSITLRNNITFTNQYSDQSYDQVVNACALKPDFEILPNGDATEIGEKGINLSGGQKQRVSLARAVYQKRDIYLMDDPLSAVDAHVGKHIFDHVIGNQGLLKGKTRILVTHSLAYLKHMDNIFVMKDGKISDRGTLSELLHKKGPFAEFLETYLTQRSRDQADEDVTEIVEELQKVDPSMLERLNSIASSGSPITSRRESHASVGSKKLSKPGKVVPEDGLAKNGKGMKGGPMNVGRDVKHETVQKGKVKWKVYLDYIRAVGYFSFFLIFSAYICGNLLGIGMNIWLSQWSQDSKKSTNESTKAEIRLAVYTALGVGQGLFIFLAVLIGTRFLVSASAKLHQRLLRNLMRSPMSFYDVTPLGAIISRIGKDVDTMDTMLPMNVRMAIMQTLNVISSIIVIIIGTPVVALAVVPLLALYYFFQKFFVCSVRQLRRLESASRAPIYSHFGETLSGVSSIRAYNVEMQFINEANFRLDENMRAVYAGNVANVWMAITLQAIGNLLVLFAALFAVLMRDHGSADAGLVGLSITYAMTITMQLMMSVFSASHLETNIVSVERIKEYVELPTEAAWITDIRPAGNWPSRGSIDFQNLQLRYRENHDLVLKGLNWRIDSNEKIGVCGRTGAGKSSTALALFRIVEPTDGRIVIDGLDISELGLHDLRSKLAIIPQDPVLFSGTLRNNLDPFDDHADEDLWAALEQAHLKQFVTQLSQGLQYDVHEGGENLSVGQRQLLCLARALLRRSRILVLDEATAAVDLETEHLILETIKSSFKDCTIITIAHRLNTIIDSDRILVMAQGRALEYEKPEVLLANADSAFYSMAKDAGLIEDHKKDD